MPKVYLEPQEVEKLESEAQYLRDRLLVRILARTGCRISEALSIKTSDIDFDAAMVTIKHLKAGTKLSCPDCGARLSKNARFCPGCGARVTTLVGKEEKHRRMRRIPVDDETLDMLREYIRLGGVRNGNLFAINRCRAWQIVHELAERANLTELVHPESGKSHGVSPHRLRDAFAVHAVKVDDSGDSLRMLQEQLGHKSFNTTARYRKVAGEELKDWYRKLWEDKHAGTGNSKN
jgi:integrase/recombinase XerD